MRIPMELANSLKKVEDELKDSEWAWRHFADYSVLY